VAALCNKICGLENCFNVTQIIVGKKRGRYSKRKIGARDEDRKEVTPS
jgi:hypothetical protein